MPIPFPQRDPDTGEWSEVDYFTTVEVSQKLHMSRDSVWRLCKSGEWPHLKVMNRYYLSSDHLAYVIDSMTMHPEQMPMWSRDENVKMLRDDTEGAG